MNLFYSVVLIAHLFSAMLFFGWGFAKLFVVNPTKKVIGKEAFSGLQVALSKRVWKIYPPNMIFLITTGTILATKYISFENGLFPSTLQTLLILKALLAYGIGAKVVYSISKRVIFKMKTTQDPNPVESNAYYYIMSAATMIILFAKLMFLF